MRNTDPRELAVGWSRVLRGRWGIATIPISAEAKRPLIYTSEYWSSFPPRPVPLGIVEDFKPRNIAVQTGVASGVVVIDVDDPAACREWFASVPRLPQTWTVKTGGGGLHFYFRLPEWLAAPLHKAILWKGDGKHQEVAFIAEQGMAITAPSRFEKRMYKWSAGPNPLRCRPAVMPRWLVELVMAKNAEKRAPKVASVHEVNKNQTHLRQWTFTTSSARFNREGSPDNRLDQLVQAGLRLASRRANASGWIACYRPDRDERVPSASVREDGSVVWTPEESFSFQQTLDILNSTIRSL